MVLLRGAWDHGKKTIFESIWNLDVRAGVWTDAALYFLLLPRLTNSRQLDVLQAWPIHAVCRCRLQGAGIRLNELQLERAITRFRPTFPAIGVFFGVLREEMFTDLRDSLLLSRDKNKSLLNGDTSGAEVRAAFLACSEARSSVGYPTVSSIDIGLGGAIGRRGSRNRHDTRCSPLGATAHGTDSIRCSNVSKFILEVRGYPQGRDRSIKISCRRLTPDSTTILPPLKKLLQKH